MRFAAPNVLWLLLPLVPSLVAFFWWAARKRKRLLTSFVNARLLPGLLAGVSPQRRRLRELCIILAVALLVVALARPQWGFSWQEVKQRGLDIVIALDTSRSMLATDIAPNRMARARLAALDLMQLARTDRLGLVAFAGNAFLQCPLTIDDAAFRQSVEAVQVGIIPHGGTALAEAIKVSFTAFKESDNYKVLVILTDGEDHDTDALETARKAAEQGLRIFTIGVGTPEGEVLQFKNDAGQQDYVRDEQGNVVKSKLNEALLQQVATAASGFYLPMRGATTMDILYQKGLAPLPKSESREKLVQRFHERFHWPLGAAILLLALEQLIPERRRIRATGVPATALALALLLVLPGISSASTWQARRHYDAGRFEEALKEYKDLMRQDKNDDPRLPYNAGVAAYRSGQFNEAAGLFSEAINTPDLKLQEQAYYNRGNALFQSGLQEQDPQTRRKAWEQALRDFEGSLKLSPHDADAKHNHDYVKRRLEELKQQQQQSQQQDSNENQQQEKEKGEQDPQNQSQQQQNQEQEDKQQSQPQQAQQDKPEQGQEQSRQDQQQDPASGGDQPQQHSGEQPKPQPENRTEEQQEPEVQPAEGKPGEMTPDQAARLLDAQEEATRLMPIRKAQTADRKVLKDW